MMVSLLRSLRIWRAVLVLVGRLWWDARPWSYAGGMSPERRERRQQRLAVWFVRELLALGSAFIKLGQLLSARPDLLPAVWVDQLAQLRLDAGEQLLARRAELRRVALGGEQRRVAEDQLGHRLGQPRVLLGEALLLLEPSHLRPLRPTFTAPRLRRATGGAVGTASSSMC